MADFLRSLWRTLRAPWDRRTALAAGAFFLTLLVFDLFWCLWTTFNPFSHFPLYVSAALVSLLLTLPYVLTRRAWTAWALLLLLDVLLVANLMYARTYFEAIPLRSYLIADNLADFMPAVWASLRWADLSFLAITGAAIYLISSSKKTRRKPGRVGGFLLWLALPVVITFIVFPTPASYKKRYAEDVASAYAYQSGPVKYSVFGKLAYDALTAMERLTPQQRAETLALVRSLPRVPALPDSVRPRRNVVIVFCESLESWVIGLNYQGHEVTPHLNALLRDSTTLYAPRLLSQAKAGRSMDGQLIDLTGLLPLDQGAYSTSYPGTYVPSLHQALKADRGSRCYLFTGDKRKVWNQERIARAMGQDTIIDYPCFRIEDNYTGKRHVGDRALVRQVVEKMKGGVWPAGEPALVQLVTYSGHGPYIMPEQERDWRLSADTPELMAGYIYCAHYTDKALGSLLEYLRSRPDWDDTMLVITADHEGLGDARASLVDTPRGRGIVEREQIIPLIVANSPVAGRIEHLGGQSDIYPTLLQLLGLTEYWWPGFGTSLLSPAHPQCAVNPWGVLKGIPADPAAPARQRAAQRASDRILRYDLLRSEH